jgi:hypothetical protein
MPVYQPDISNKKTTSIDFLLTANGKFDVYFFSGVINANIDYFFFDIKKPALEK